MPNTYMVYSIVPMKPRKGYPKREADPYSEIFWFGAACFVIAASRAWLVILLMLICI